MPLALTVSLLVLAVVLVVGLIGYLINRLNRS
jgi:preprotein translocase subunit Sss1